ncbi:hypothetical protein IFM89_003610 [Coptis chinensis]|uniref:Uncharacterized protein n=1 Tax=Coptis chinensis TaxID=261450 RepID=A0A835H652_9MAGN|nr:hypothetical protein IFM89_003610 [Coptis chinensis]
MFWNCYLPFLHEYIYDALHRDRDPVLSLKSGQKRLLLHRQVQEASPPSDNEGKSDILEHPAGGGHHWGGNENHHGKDIKSRDKQHPRPPF